MMNRWLLACFLVLCCSLAVGCSLGGDREVNDGPKAANEETQASKDANKDLEAVKASLTKAGAAIKKAQQANTAPVSTGPSPNTNQGTGGNQQSSPRGDGHNALLTSPQLRNAIDEALTEIRSIASPLGNLQNALAAQPETQESYEKVRIVSTSVDDASQQLEAASAALTENAAEQGPKLNSSLKEALGLVEVKALNAANNVKIPTDLTPSSSSWPSLNEIVYWLAIILGSILGLVLLITTSSALVKTFAARADARINRKIQPLTSLIQKQQTEVGSQLTALTTTQNELQTRIADLEFEIKKVAKVARDAANDGVGRRIPTPAPAFSSFEEPVERDEPVFPISIGDYLVKMRRSSNIVRPDFQNDILVSDPGGTGELVLIRDAAIPDDLQPLFVIPRATQFQTKQDFYTYYQKYYECARPSAGDVWIVDPAVVSKVSGGWQLREKGVLEVR